MKNSLTIIFILFVLISCGKKMETTADTGVTRMVEETVTLSEAQLKSAAVVIHSFEKRDISTVLKVTGAVDVPPQSMVSISMPLGGYLKSTKLLPGMHLKKGEVIATMEDQQYIQLQEDYLVTKSRLTYAEAEFNRQKDLNQSKSSSDKVFQQAKMEYDNQRIALNALGEKLKLIHIDPSRLNEQTLSRTIQVYSPINGYVSGVNVNIGKYVTPADVLFELVNPSDIHLNLRVFEKDIAKLSIGQNLVAYTINEPQKKYPCEIMLISQSLSADRTAEVHCHFEQYDRSLLPGMYMNAEIAIRTHDAYAVPDEAVVLFEGSSYLFTAIAENQFRLVPVETGVSEGGYTQILNGDTLANERIVYQGAYTLLMEMKNKSED